MNKYKCPECEGLGPNIPCPNNGHCPMCSDEDIAECPECKVKHCWFCGGMVQKPKSENK